MTYLWNQRSANGLITNYALIGKYRARFFPNKNTSYLCNDTQLEMHHHILHEGSFYSKYNQVIDFLQHNL